MEVRWKSFQDVGHIQLLRHRPSRYIRSVPYNLRDSILSPSPFPYPLRVQINNYGLVQRIVITQKKKTCRPIPSISLSMHPMMHELVRSLRGLIHHCRMQDKNVSDHLFFSTLFFSTPTLSPPQSNPRARLQKYWLFRQLHCR